MAEDLAKDLLARAKRMSRERGLQPADADDVAQEAALQALRKVRDQPAMLPGAVVAWHRCAVDNLCTDMARRVDAAQRTQQGLADRATGDGRPTPQEAAELEELRKAVQREASRLPPPYRVTLDLRYAKGLRVPEIAARMGVPVGTVKARLSRAQHQLKRGLRGFSLL
jgi:RNA polymerase sigma-70 factor (ECF subfamily)